MGQNMAVMVGTIGQGVLRSDDGGQEWVRKGINMGMHSNAIIRCLIPEPQVPEIVYAGSDMGLYRSQDAGRTWELTQNALNKYTVWRVAIDPQDPNVMYAGTGTPSPCSLFRSTDKGVSWEQLSVQIADTCINTGVPRFTGMEVDPFDSRTIWGGLEVDGVRCSRDGGNTWNAIDGGIPNPDIHGLVVVEGPPKTIIVVVANGIYTSADGGETWKEYLAKDTFPLSQPRCIATQPGNPKTIFLGVGDSSPGNTGVVLRSKDLGETWQNLPMPVQPNSSFWWIGTHKADPNVVYSVTRFGYLYRSNDGGDSWRKEWREFGHAAQVVWVPL